MISNITETVTVELSTGKKTLTVLFDYWPGSTGSYWEPPEPPEVDVKSLKDSEGNDVDFINMDDPDYYRLSDALIEKYNERFNEGGE